MQEQPMTKSTQKTLEELPDDLSPIERILLTAEGTVQTMLATIFFTPIEVEVLHQCELPSAIIRNIRLLSDKQPVCIAHTVIPIEGNPDGFLTGIREQNWGIGRLIATIPLTIKKVNYAYFTDPNIIGRIYEIQGKCTAHITEIFPRKPLNFPPRQ